MLGRDAQDGAASALIAEVLHSDMQSATRHGKSRGNVQACQNPLFHFSQFFPYLFVFHKTKSMGSVIAVNKYGEKLKRHRISHSL